MYQPANLPLAIRFVATSFIVLCDAPEERIVATRHALKSKRNKCKISSFSSRLVPMFSDDIFLRKKASLVVVE